jgi:hypothetical protein
MLASRLLARPSRLIWGDVSVAGAAFVFGYSYFTGT